MQRLTATWNRRQFLGVGVGTLGASQLTNNRRLWRVSGSSRGSLRAVFYTDVHARTEWQTPLGMQRAADAIRRQGADLVIAGGDLITDGFQNSAHKLEPRWKAYLDMHRLIGPDIRVTMGNHDLVAAIPEDGSEPSKDPRRTFRETFALDRTYYSFDAVGYHFVVLDSIQVTGDKLLYQGYVDPEQMEWLKEDLSNVSVRTPIILVTHIPLLTAFYSATVGPALAAPRNRVVVNSVEVLDLFREHNLILVLQGHLHIKETIQWQGTTFITGGAVCAKWWRGNYYGTEEGFGLLNFTENQFEWEYLDYGWQAKRP